MRARPWNGLALLAVGLLTLTGGDKGCGCDDSASPPPDCYGTATITFPADGACILVNTPVDLTATYSGTGGPTGHSWSAGSGLANTSGNPATVTFTTTGDFTLRYYAVLDGPGCGGGAVSREITIHVRDDCMPPEPTVELGVFASPVDSPDGVTVFSKIDWALPTLPYGVAFTGALGSVVIDPASRAPVHTFDSGQPWLGNLAVKGGKTRSGAVPTDGFVEFGAGGALLHTWDDALQEWSAFSEFIVTFTTVLDVAGYAESRGGFTATTGGSVRFFEWTDGGGFAAAGSDILSSDFPGIPGDFVSSLARSDTGPFVAVADGSPGTAYVHDRTSGHAATPLGDVGISPRRVRRAGTVFAITSFASDSLFVGTWDNSDNIALTDGVGVGDGPVGVDVVDLGNGTVAAVTTGFSDNTYTITVIDTAGNVVSNTTTAAPAGIVNPAHAAFLGADHKIVMTGFSSNNYAVVASGL